MKATPADVVRALLELSKELPDGEKFLQGVRDELVRHIGKAESVLSVTIATPTGDAGDLRQVVTEHLRTHLKREVDIREKADKSLIGGAVITFGDEQIDLSVRGALEQAASAFVSGVSHS